MMLPFSLLQTSRPETWLFRAAVTISLLGGCASSIVVPAQANQPAKGVRITCVLDKKSSLFQRGVLYLEPTKKVRVIVEGPPLTDTPFKVDKELASLEDGVGLTVDNVPSGKLRIVTLQWLDASGNPIEGLYYRAQGTIDDLHQRLVFTNQSTAEGEVLLAASKKRPDDVLKLLSTDISNWMASVLSTAKVPNARFLDVNAVADAMIGLSTKNVPAAKPEWGIRPGWVSVPFRSIQKGLRILASVNDSVSGAAESVDGDTVLIGPIPARDGIYKMTVRAIPTGNELIGPDLIYPAVDVVVKSGATTIAEPFVLSRSVVGEPLPDRIGRANTVVVGDGDSSNLWLLNGLLYHDDDVTSATALATAIGAGTGLTKASATSYRFSTGGGWEHRGNLSAGFPIYGAATASSGNQLFCFGGYSAAGKRLSDVFVVDPTNGNVTGAPGILPNGDGGKPMGLAEGVAAAIGDRIYITGGVAHAAGGVDANGVPLDNGLAETLVYNPTTKTFDPSAAGPSAPYKSMAGAVVNGKWYVFGGYKDPLTPKDDAQIFDPGTVSWGFGSPMPTPRYGAATAVKDGKIWVIGGETLGGEPCRAVEVYDPVQDTWTRRAPLRWACSYAAAIAVGGKIHVAGGVAGTSDTGFALPLRSTQTEDLTP